MATKPIEDMNREEVVTELDAFAKEHGLQLEVHGEVGFGRPCVGLLGPGRENYVDHNPLDHGFDPVWPEDERLYAPDGVDAYHKHNCFAVLCADVEAGYAKALVELLTWVRAIQGAGDIYVAEYPTGATGIQAMLSGTTGYALRLR